MTVTEFLGKLTLICFGITVPSAADSIMVIISGILLSVPILSGFTEFNIQPYRWIPLIAFFAIGVGVLLTKRQAG